ncbi:MAG: class I SAM-dependent methyltransferase [Bacteroidota bacterium]
MNSPEVHQRPVLNTILRNELRTIFPGSLLILGCSTGNGLEHIDPHRTKRIDCVEINPIFAQRLKERFQHLDTALTLHCIDVNEVHFDPAAYDLVYAALIFEYVDWKSLLTRIAEAIVPGGFLSVVIQLRSDSTPAVTPTQYKSLLALESIFHFVDPGELAEQAKNLNLILISRATEPLPSGKAFEIFRFTNNPSYVAAP